MEREGRGEARREARREGLSPSSAFLPFQHTPWAMQEARLVRGRTKRNAGLRFPGTQAVNCPLLHKFVFQYLHFQASNLNFLEFAPLLVGEKNTGNTQKQAESKAPVVLPVFSTGMKSNPLSKKCGLPRWH